MRVGLVVQRYGEEVLGGAELHARWIAEHLARRHEVEALTTCAVDYLSWHNRFEPGESVVNGVRVRRFPVARRRTPEGYDEVAGLVHFYEHTDEEERRWMEEHGPVTPELIDHLRARQEDYDALVFFSYRYWTTFHGLRVAPRRSILVPTAEDDPTIGLRLFRDFFALPAAYAFNSPEERELISRAAGRDDLPGEVVGVGIEAPPPVDAAAFRRRAELPGEYLIYVGRIEQAKGCARLFADFMRYVEEEREPDLHLLLLGRAVLEVPVHPRIVHLGALSDAEKLAAIQGSRALVHPSPFESLSMSLLEAWMMARPALVNGRCAVLRGQVLRAHGGLPYRGYVEFAECLRWLLGHRREAEALGEQGRAYFQENYAWDVILEKYERLLARVAGNPRAPRPA